MAKKHAVAAVLLLIALAGFISNSKNVGMQLLVRYDESSDILFSEQQEDVDVDAPIIQSAQHAHHRAHHDTKRASRETSIHDDCLKARNEVPIALHRNLPRPYINLGFPKMGTSSLHAYFQCGGLTSRHLRCSAKVRGPSCAQCTKESVAAGLPPLAQCGGADAYAQIDNGAYFPQIELLEEFVRGHPNATFVLTFRDMAKWYHSISNWPPRKHGPYMKDRFMREKYNISGAPAPPGTPEKFNEWYCNHVTRVRDVISHSPSSNAPLVEVDIEDPTTGQRMEDMFGIDGGCWGQKNVNLNIHPGVDESEVSVSRHNKKDGNDGDDLRPKRADRDDDDGDDDEEDDDADNGDEEDNDDDANDDDDESNGNTKVDGINKKSTAANVESFREIAKRMKKAPSPEKLDKMFFNRTCFRANNDSVSRSLYHKLPKPYINLGFPKMGTNSLYEFFKCGGLKATHYSCGKGSPKCAQCARQSVEAGLPPLAQCGKADVYAQIDNGTYFPQIELLNEFVHGHPDATFFLTFRDMTKWYHSISNWPPRKNGPYMKDRFMKYDITGSPSREGTGGLAEFSTWYCDHVTRVRELVARNPSHTLVEIDIEDPGMGGRMEDMFGIEQSCWGRANVNALLHPEEANLSEKKRVAGKTERKTRNTTKRRKRGRKKGVE